MQVPVRRAPNTRVSEQQQGFAKAVPGLDVSSITRALSSGTDVVQGLREKLKEEERGRQKLELSKRFMQRVNERQEDFETRRRDPNLEPMAFADNTELEYSKLDTEFLEEFRGKGFDEDIIDEFDLKLGVVRQGFFEKALGHQIATLSSRANEDLEELGVHLSQYIAANPGAYASAETMVNENLANITTLTEEEKEAKRDELLAVIREGGKKAIAIQDPDLIIRSFDPQGLTALHRTASTAGGSVSTAGLDADRSTVATTLSTELPAPVVAGFLGNFDVEAGYTGAQGDGGTASGVAQWRKERRAAFKAMFGKDPHEATKEEQARFVLHEMKNPEQAGMTVAQRDAILAATTPEEAAELIDRYYERSSGKHRSERIEASKKYAAIEPASEVVTGESAAPVASTDKAKTIADVQTGNALLDSLNGPERLQVLGWAREQQSKVLASRKAEMDVWIGNYSAEALETGEPVTPPPSDEQIMLAYGPLEGPQRIAQVHQVKDTGRAMQAFRTQSTADIQRELDVLKPTPGSPTYETELQIYRAAERAASSIAAERDRDPAAYAMKYFPSIEAAAAKGTTQYYAELDRVYQQLGIDPKYAPVLPAQAVDRLVQDYKVMNPAQRRKYMQDNFRAMGEDRFIRFTSSMEGTTAQDDARIFALMGRYRGTRAEWEAVYQQVLEGREIMAQDPARRPSNEDLTKQFRVEGAQAISNLNAQASRAIQEAASALYVARGGDPKKIDATLYKESLATALGGSLPVNMRKGAVQDYTILPSKATQQRFEAWQESLTFEKITRMSVEQRPPRYGDLKTAVPIEDIIDEGVFVMTSPGRYMIKMASDGRPLMTSTGRPFLVNINPRDIP